MNYIYRGEIQEGNKWAQTIEWKHERYTIPLIPRECDIFILVLGEWLGYSETRY